MTAAMPREGTKKESGLFQSCQPLRREYLQGATYKAIAEKYQIDQRTAKRYVQLNLPLEEYEHRPYSSVLNRYMDHIRKWIFQDHLSSAQIHRTLLENGCHCSYSLVNRAVQRILRNECSSDLSYGSTISLGELGDNRQTMQHSSTNTVKPLSEKIQEERIYAEHSHI